MTHGTLKFAHATLDDRWEITRRAEELRGAEVQRLASALARRIRAVVGAIGARPAPEPVQIPRAPSSAIF